MYTLRVLWHKVYIRLIKLTAILVSVPKPIVYVGPGSSHKLATHVAQTDVSHVLLVTDGDLINLRLHERVQHALESNKIKVTVFSNISPNPALEEVERGIQMAKTQQCDAVLAIGGGSPMDAAKMIAVGINNARSIEKMSGFFKVKHTAAPLYLIPTTAGTGSEATIGAVITQKSERRKFSIADPKLVPLATALDPDLMLDLPKTTTAYTGLDALTHAVETYLSTLANDHAKRYSTIALRLIFDNLSLAFNDGTNINARENMSIAAFYAGLAINEAGLGYTHAIAHQLGGFYGVPHGLANAMVLPHVLNFSKPHIVTSLAELAQIVRPQNNTTEKMTLAQQFIDDVTHLIRSLNIPDTLDVLKAEHFDDITQRAIAEGFDYYAVPCYMKPHDCKNILQQLAG